MAHSHSKNKSGIKKPIEVISVFGYSGYKVNEGKEKYTRSGYVNVWVEVDNLSLTAKEARKLSKLLAKAADKAEKVEK